MLAYGVIGKLKTAWLVDLLAVNSEVAAKLLEERLRSAKQDQLDMFKMWETKQTSAFARQLGLRRASRKPTLVMSVQDSRLPMDLAGNIANWCVNFGDTEDWI